jgi:hypothetical protein
MSEEALTPRKSVRGRPVLTASLDAELLAEIRAQAERTNVPISRVAEELLRVGMAAVQKT